MTNTNSDLAGQIEDRFTRMKKLNESGIDTFANDFIPTHSIEQVINTGTNQSLPTQEEIRQDAERFKIAGRLIQISDFGKVKFLFIRGSENYLLQGLMRKNDNPELFALTKEIQSGDIIGFKGALFRTNQGKRAILIEDLCILTKALLPLPGKILQDEQDVNDVELLYRRRYLDFIQHPDKIDIFKKRALIISSIRRALDDAGFMEVETRMMLATNGGASAKPFKTHHNTLNRDFNLRIAPELDLKRCIVGGMEKVYEIGRQFRNEGMDRFHNPEFTSLEFYEAFSNYEIAMAKTEHLIRTAATEIGLGNSFNYQDIQVNMNEPFICKAMLESVLEIVPDLPEQNRSGSKLVESFEQYVEHTLIQPTFITHYPVESSPLARRNENDPRFTDRFELFICGKEIANGFSELTNPIDQNARFVEQVAQKALGNEEAMDFDEDYITALRYGMPPCAGVGIGIDRLVMLLTNQSSIRDVILFPQMR